MNAVKPNAGRELTGARTPPPPPQEPKGPPDEIVKNFKWYKNNVVVVGLTTAMHFQQFEDLKFPIFPREHAPDLPKTHAECPTVPN